MARALDGGNPSKAKASQVARIARRNKARAASSSHSQPSTVEHDSVLPGDGTWEKWFFRLGFWNAATNRPNYWMVAATVFVFFLLAWRFNAFLSTDDELGNDQPRTQPKVVKLTQITNSFSDNEARVLVSNEGAAGNIAVSVLWWHYHETVERGESGVEGFFRENFSREKAPSDKLVLNRTLAKTWRKNITLGAGEQTEILFKLPGHTVTVPGELDAYALPATTR